MNKLYALLFILFSYCSFDTLAQGPIPTVGTDFWFGFLSNYSMSSESLDVFISGNQATSGTISSPLQGWSVNFNVTPGLTTTVTIPENIGGNYIDDAISQKGIHIVSDDTVSVFAINFRSYSADGTLVLPIKSLGTDYMVSSFQGVYGESEFVIIATADGTEVEITPSAATTGGHAAGTPYIVQLDEGETYQVKSTGDLTGSKIVGTPASGDCRPFGLFSGVVCANVPTTCTYCDHIYDQNYSIDTWGRKYYIAPFLNSTSYTYRIVARDNGTNVTINGAPIAVLNSGQFYTTSLEPNDLVIEADKPIAVVQYMEGVSCSGGGDPSMLILNSDERKINDVTFSTVSSSVITNHSLNVIVESASVGSLMLDGVAVGAGSFTAFVGDPTMSYARLNITQGSHNINLATGFSAYSYGTGNAESYAYNVGSFLPQAIIPVDTAYCSSDSVVLSAGAGIFNPWWSTQTNPTDTILTGSVLVLHPPIINDVYVVRGYSLASGCLDEKYYSVESPDPPQLTLSQSDDTLCKFDNVLFTMGVNPMSTSYNVQWSPPYLFDDPSSFNPILSAQESGWYKVTVSTLSGCGISTDSLYIEVLGGGVKDILITTTDAMICAPDTAQLDLKLLQILEFDDFNGGINPGLWNSLSGQLITDTCAVISGDALYFNGAGTRIAETIDFDLTGGGTLEFYLEIANGVAPCDNADFGENVVLEYSTNGGGAWNPISTYFENAYPNFTLVNVNIPLAAQTTATRFRWRQTSFTGTDEDVWMLENVSVSTYSNSNFTVSWSPAASLDNANIPNPIASPTVPTWYVATVISGLCEYKDSIFINAGTPFTLNVTPDVSLCSVVPVNLSATPSSMGNYTYTWSPNTNLSSTTNPSTTSTTNSSITYYVNVVSDFECSVTDSVQIYIASQATAQIIGDTVVCIGDSTNIEVSMTGSSGNFAATWTDQNNVVVSNDFELNQLPTVSQWYFVTLEDTVANCQTLDSVYLTVNNLLLNIGNDTTLCTENGYQFSVQTTYVNPTISWSNSGNLTNSNTLSPSLINPVSQYYTLTLTEGTCQSKDSLLITYFSRPNVVDSLTEHICEFDTLIVNMNGGTNYVWDNPSLIQNGGTATPGFFPSSYTEFYLNFDYGLGCHSTDSLYIDVVPYPQISFIDTIYKCPTNAVLLSPIFTNVDVINWSTTQQTATITVSQSNTYYVQGTNLCTTIMDSVSVIDYAISQVDLGPDSSLCYYESMIVTAGNIDPTTTVVWSNAFPGNSQTSVAPNYLTVIATDTNFCSTYDSLTITLSPVAPISLGPDFTYCSSANPVLTVNNFTMDHYLWNTGDTTTSIPINMGGTYIVFGVDQYGCNYFDSVTVTEVPNPHPSITGNLQYCPGLTTDLSTDLAYPTYVWSTGDFTPSITVGAPYGQIWVQVTDANNCIGSDTVNLSEIQLPPFSLGPDYAICPADFTQIDAQIIGGSGYVWDNVFPNPVYTTGVGTHFVEFTFNTCQMYDTIIITPKALPTISLGSDVTTCPGDDIAIYPFATFYDSIVWQDSSTNIPFIPQEDLLMFDSLYVVATAYGCGSATDSMLVYVENCNCIIYIPNTFTPDGNEFNNTFGITHLCDFESFELNIYNRWGELIFTSFDPAFQWDGALADGSMCPDGTYTWTMTYVTLDDFGNMTTHTLNGHISLMR